ncbi:MAG: hypothetical protein IPP72_13400 [Chitinophagaceae bacterium]|nr:hypothetical protein [Chitinophagaceae bacterium]
MKKFVTMVTVAVLLVSASAFATDAKEVSAKVRTAFEKDFAKASNVSWEAKDNFYFADFSVNNTKFNAAYNEDGQLVATSRTIVLDQLPIAVTQALNEKYAGYTLGAAVIELNYERQTSYFISVANGKQVLRLKATANGDLSVENKTKL